MALLRLRGADRRGAAAAADDAGRLARDAFTYIHIPIVAGIIVAAVGDELVIAHPGEELQRRRAGRAWPAARRSTCWGTSPSGCAWRASISRKRLGAAAACIVVGAAAAPLPGLAVSAMVTGVMVVLIAAEAHSGRRSRMRGEESPLEAFEASLAREGGAPPR